MPEYDPAGLTPRQHRMYDERLTVFRGTRQANGDLSVSEVLGGVWAKIEVDVRRHALTGDRALTARFEPNKIDVEAAVDIRLGDYLRLDTLNRARVRSWYRVMGEPVVTPSRAGGRANRRSLPVEPCLPPPGVTA